MQLTQAEIEAGIAIIVAGGHAILNYFKNGRLDKTDKKQQQELDAYKLSAEESKKKWEASEAELKKVKDVARDTEITVHKIQSDLKAKAEAHTTCCKRLNSAFLWLGMYRDKFGKLPEDNAQLHDANDSPIQILMAAKATQGGKKVLIVEDDVASRRPMGIILRSHGYETHEASTVADAISTLLETQPDYIFLDLALPDGDGAEVLRKVHEIGSGARVIVSTGSSDMEKLQIIKDLHPAAFLPKPIGGVADIARAMGVTL